MNISHSELLSTLRYDAGIGRFFWLTKRGKHKPGDLAGSFDAHGYGQVNINYVIYKEHRLVWFYVTGEWPVAQIDHLNHDRRDNRFENLRQADNRLNHQNRPMQRNNTSGQVGVSFDKRTGWYRATIGNKSIGRFVTKEEAIAARLLAQKELGYHQNHGIGYGRSRERLRATTGDFCGR